MDEIYYYVHAQHNLISLHKMITYIHDNNKLFTTGTRQTAILNKNM